MPTTEKRPRISPLQYENVISINKVPDILPDRVSIRTVWRWATRGVRGHKLESFVLGHRRLTSVEATERFFAKIQ